MVVGAACAHEHCGAVAHVGDDLEPERIAVELGRALRVADVENGVVETANSHDVRNPLKRSTIPGSTDTKRSTSSSVVDHPTEIRSEWSASTPIAASTGDGSSISDEHEAHVLGGRAHQQRRDEGVHEARLAGPGRARDEQVRHLREVHHLRPAVDVLAEGDLERVGEVHERLHASHVLGHAALAGDVRLGPDVSIWYGAVLRADLAPIIVGAGANVQDGTVVHVADDTPCVIGEETVVGHRAMLHACRVEPRCLIGMQSTILDEAVIGHGSVVGAGTVVTPRTVIPPPWTSTAA